MIGKRNAYSLMVGLVLFNAAIPIAVSMGFTGPLTGAENIGIIGMYVEGLQNVGFWTTILGVAAAFTVISKVSGIRVTFSSVFFMALFAVTSSPLHAILNQMQSAGWITSSIYSFIVLLYSLAFIIGIMELSR